MPRRRIARNRPLNLRDAVAAIAVPLFFCLVWSLPAQATENFGALSWSIPLDLPAGPGVGAPQLALGYSSTSNLGNAGVGWDLPYSAVRMDVRDGSPIWSLPDSWDSACDPSAAEEWSGRVLLDGIELVPSPSDPTFNGACVWRTRPDQFAVAKPFFRSGSGDTSTVAGHPAGWVVIKPDGTTWWYGDSPATPRGESNYTVTRAGGGGSPVVNAWYLHQVVDRDGNQVTWWNTRSFPDGDVPGNSGLEVAVKAVTWAARLEGDSGYAHGASGGAIAGVTDSGGPYMGAGYTGLVARLLEDPGPWYPQDRLDHYYVLQVHWEDRHDVRTSWLSGQKTSSHRRIHQISVGRDPDLSLTSFGLIEVDVQPQDWIRSWLFQYDTSSTGRSRLRRLWPVHGFSADGKYPSQGVVQDLLAELDLTDPTIVQNPWEFDWSESATLPPDQGDATLQSFGPGELYTHSADLAQPLPRRADGRVERPCSGLVVGPPVTLFPCVAPPARWATGGERRPSGWLSSTPCLANIPAPTHQLRTSKGVARPELRAALANAGPRSSRRPKGCAGAAQRSRGIEHQLASDARSAGHASTPTYAPPRSTASAHSR